MRICLSMIIKNETKVIERCLRSVMPHIDSWAIVDTGSTDGTQDLVRRIMAGVPGELAERPWVDFATNRNQALDLARQHGDYALIIDADEILEAAADFSYGKLGAPGYLFQLLFGDTRYRRVAMPRLDADWHWEGVLHEVLVSPQAAQAEFLPGLSIRVFTDGARSQQSQEQKFSHDAEVLGQALLKEPGHTRYSFYYAQSLRDAGKTHEAIEAYEKRVALGGWAEEVYFAKLQVAVLKERVGAPPGKAPPRPPSSGRPSPSVPHRRRRACRPRSPTWTPTISARRGLRRSANSRATTACRNAISSRAMRRESPPTSRCRRTSSSWIRRSTIGVHATNSP